MRPSATQTPVVSFVTGSAMTTPEIPTPLTDPVASASRLATFSEMAVGLDPPFVKTNGVNVSPPRETEKPGPFSYRSSHLPLIPSEMGWYHKAWRSIMDRTLTCVFAPEEGLHLRDKAGLFAGAGWILTSPRQKLRGKGACCHQSWRARLTRTRSGVCYPIRAGRALIKRITDKGGRPRWSPYFILIWIVSRTEHMVCRAVPQAWVGRRAGRCGERAQDTRC